MPPTRCRTVLQPRRALLKPRPVLCQRRRKAPRQTFYASLVKPKTRFFVYGNMSHHMSRLKNFTLDAPGWDTTVIIRYTINDAATICRHLLLVET